MRKTLAAANRGERVPFKIPRSVQQSIPIQRVWQDGIWQVNGRFSQTWRFADINYSLASYEDQRDMFTSYCGVLNSLPTDAVTKITIHNRRLNSSDFQHSVLMRECGDDLDLYRREYNRVLTERRRPATTSSRTSTSPSPWPVRTRRRPGHFSTG